MVHERWQGALHFVTAAAPCDERGPTSVIFGPASGACLLSLAVRHFSPVGCCLSRWWYWARTGAARLDNGGCDGVHQKNGRRCGAGTVPIVPRLALCRPDR